MAIAETQHTPPITERRFFTGMAVAMAIAAFIGFAPTYYLAALNDAPTPALTPSVHLHGALTTAWVLLLIVQTSLIAAKRYDIHKAMGLAGIFVALGILVSGFHVAIASERRVFSEANAGTLGDPYVFLIFPLSAVVIFAVFVALGVANRHRPDFHKRLMLLATLSLIFPAVARIFLRSTSIMPGPIGGMILADIFLVALVAYDLVTRGRLHPVTLWGGGFLLLSELLRVAIGFSEPWQMFARSLMG